MEKYVTLFLPLMLGVVLLRLLALPLRFVWKLGIHALGGFLCLWLLDSVAPFTGIFLPVNPVTVLTAGFLGLPGITLLAALAVFP